MNMYIKNKFNVNKNLCKEIITEDFELIKTDKQWKQQKSVLQNQN